MTISMKNFKAWATQPTTIHGFGVVALGAFGAAAHFAGANNTISIAIGMAAYALTHLGINDSSQSKSVEQLIQDAATAVMSNRLAAELPALMAEGMAAIGAFATQAPTTVVSAPDAQTVVVDNTVNPPAAPAPAPLPVAPNAPAVAPAPPAPVVSTMPVPVSGPGSGLPLRGVGVSAPPPGPLMGIVNPEPWTVPTKPMPDWTGAAPR